jgi:predicted ATPase
MAQVWPGRVVEDNNLQVQIAALRKVLAGERELIRTIAGRGYQFIGEIRNTAQPGPTAPLARHNLPETIAELIGREAELRDVLELAVDRRLLTLTGAGGIGKTRLGLEVARRLQARFDDGVWLAELGPLSDPQLVPVTVAAALGLTFAAGALSPERVASALGSKQVLLVLDNCEHVIDAAAAMAGAIMRACPGTWILVTSREALRAQGESVYRVPALEVPAAEILEREQLLKAGAMRLFMARAHAAEPQFSPDTHIVAIAAICRQLDGIPLAIELAAARVAALGVEGLAARLHDRFKLLTGGHRTALPRHQTLRATLDWSYDLLPGAERVVLHRLAVFAGGFTLESASAVTSGVEIAAADVFDYVANLVAKSLVTADVGGAIAHYRLLGTMRAYALDKLVDSGEFDQFARRHAIYHIDLLERAAAEGESSSAATWLAGYGRQIDNVRAALDWAFSTTGDTSIGVALTIAAVPLWFQLSLIDECRGRVEQALVAMRSVADRGTRCDMQLFAAQAGALLYSKGPGQEVNAAWTRALKIAENLDDPDYRLRALWGLWASRTNSGEPGLAMVLAQDFASLATRTANPADALVGKRMIGLSLHLLGEQATARRHIEHMLGRYATGAYRAGFVRFQFDQRVLGGATLGQILWVLGFPEQALRTAKETADLALAIDHSTSLCHALAHSGCRIALLTGDIATAERFVELLLAHSARHALDLWNTWGRCYKGVLLAENGDTESGMQVLSVGLDDLREAGLGMPRTAFLGDMAKGHCKSGEIAKGMAAIEEALERAERNAERWCIPELLRIKGDLLLQANAADGEPLAEDHFARAIDCARQQGALAWELRAASSYARLRIKQGRYVEARALLAPVYERFTEGFDTSDLKAARALLDALPRT